MRIVHTSDWHLGRTLHGVDLLGHQAAYLDHLVELVRAERVDAVLVAGDVYDRAIPPVEAVEVLSDALARLSETAAVVLTPGNHDSAVRLGFGAALMRPGVHVRARLAQVGSPVELADEHGAVVVHALPYLEPDAARDVLVDDEGAGEDGRLPRSHEAVTAAAMRRVRRDLAGRPAGTRGVVMAHAFVVGGEASGSERDIRVGGVDSVPAGVFTGADYVALGHLHGAQRLQAPTGPEGPGGCVPVLQYSGSPLAYSFGERHQSKASFLVDLDAAGVADVTPVAAPVPRRLAELVGPLVELLGPLGERHREDWVHVVATDEHRPADLVARVRAALPHALVIEHRSPVPRTRAAAVVTAARDPLEVAGEFVAHVTGAPPTPAEAAVLRRAYEDVLAAERSA